MSTFEMPKSHSSTSSSRRPSRFDADYERSSSDRHSSSSRSTRDDQRYSSSSYSSSSRDTSNRYKPYSSSSRPSSSSQYQSQDKLSYERGLSRFASYDSPYCDVHKILDADSSLEKKLFNKVKNGINFDQETAVIDIKATGTNVPPEMRTFEECNFHDIIRNNIKLSQYDKPTPVQRNAMPIIMGKRDLMACAQTGSGKTAAFLMPIMNAIYNTREPIVGYKIASGVRQWLPVGLVLAPTRELALQIYDEALKFTYRSNLRSFVVYGGADIRTQMRNLDSNGCHLLVATPGRLTDLHNKGVISYENIKYLVLDEADRMLDMGFEPQIREIVQQKNMPKTGVRQTLLFSATFPKQIQILAKDFLHDYIFLAVGRVGSTSSNITQRFVWASENEKHSCLLNILDSNPDDLVLIFVETRRCCDELERYLQQKQFPAISIHGKKSQSERERALQMFRNGQKQILVATAVAARGLDISNVKFVVNFDLTNDIDDYVHRIGRTGRAGSSGQSISFFNDKNRPLVNDLYNLLKESQQEIPDFISRMVGSRVGNGGGGYKRSYNSGNGHSRFSEAKHEYSDYRHSEPATQTNGNGYTDTAYKQPTNGSSYYDYASYAAAALYHQQQQASAAAATTLDPALSSYLAYILPQMPPPPPPPES